MKSILYKQIACISRWLILCMACLCHTGCKDELIISGQTDGPEGLPATVTVSLAANDMNIQSRALTDEQMRTVNDLWIGIYSATTGELTGSMSPREIGKVIGTHEAQEITVSAKSGRSYIVAVANSIRNLGITDNEELSESLKGNDQWTYHPRYLLSDLLEKADTWEKFKSISAALFISNEVSLYTANMVMSGVYYKETSSDPIGGWASEPESVYISGGTTKLDGAIHLRSVYSHITFNVRAGEHTYIDGNKNEITEKITFEPLSWQVYNVPAICYLKEQEHNSADISTTLLSESGMTTHTGSYDNTVASPNFENIQGEDGPEEDGYTFNFYMYENKHEAIGEVNDYEEREKEYKNGDGSNTGIYVSLCPDSDTPDVESGKNVNNFATYVELKAHVTYTANDDAGNVTTRSGYPTYTIHLGYIDGATDFNVNRHTKYTYNVTINGVDKIRVEAKADDGSEDEPGAEGHVTDAQRIYELDAHFGVFNIKLSNKDRTSLNYRIRAPYGDDVTILDSYLTADPDNQTWLDPANENNKFFKWIHFKPVATKDEHVLAVYRTSKSGEDNDDALRMDLNTLKTKVQQNEGIKLAKIHPLDTSNGDPNDTTKYWYTVFVDEYVYEDSSDETGGNWVNYVNKEDRAVWLSLAPTDISKDAESMYSNATYLIHQKSIMTYYSETNLSSNETALGVELVNENYGQNLIWTADFKPTYNGTQAWSDVNGRWNTMQYLGNKTNGMYWQTYANITKSDERFYIRSCYSPAITNRQLENKEENYALLYSTNPLSGTDYATSGGKLDNNNYAWYNIGTVAPNPDKSYYEIMEACLMRNRDENGDGVIDNEELKWYLPTSGKYLRLVLGESGFSVTNRLMNYSAFNFTTRGYNEWQRFHYATSNQKMIWAEESTSLSEIYVYNSTSYDATWDRPSVPWQIRCVRNLGTNLSANVPHDEPVELAYQHNESERKIVPAYYNDNVKRQPVTDVLTTHLINDLANRLATDGFEYYERDIYINSASESTSYHNNWGTQYSTVCSQFNKSDETPWRVPNQKELTIMRDLGVFSEVTNAEDVWLSCTKEYYQYRPNDKDELTRRWMGVNTGRTYAVSSINTGSSYNGRLRIRCVRDIY